jgi:exodeoxyribonuclease V alpha subunit
MSTRQALAARRRATALPPDQVLAQGFAHHVERWARAQGAPAAAVRAVACAARALSLATSNGHVCIHLADLASPAPDAPAQATEPGAVPGAVPAPAPAAPLPDGPAAWRAALLAARITGTPAAPGTLPLILDDDDRLYLHRYFDYERRLARRLTLAGGTAPDAAGPPSPPALAEMLSELFAANEARLGGAADWQKLAAALALRGRLTVISGGPGTGKTTTVVNLLACLLALDPQCRIALAAPTGKAAARMTEAIRLRSGHLPPETRERLPAESFTIHRLLRVRPGGGFVHDAARPLAIDALVVDEASMLDLALATRLLEAVPPSARIILLGDKDQLAAVESGAVFSELSVDPTLSASCIDDLAALARTPAAGIRPPAPVQPSALHDAAVWFTQNFRFARDSGIGRLAALVNGGAAGAALQWLRGGEDAGVEWLAEAATPAASRAPAGPGVLRRVEEGYAPFLEAVAANPTRAGAITEAFGRFRVLCALREGPRGVAALNAEMTRRFRAALLSAPGIAELHARGALRGLDEHAPWFPGRPVIVLNNDYVLRLYNGDIGIALPDATGELLVHFPDAASPGGFRAIAPVRLPHHETAFAMTVHKSQGSEFDSVLVMLPGERSRVLTRELLYTAITRARSRVAISAPAAVLEAAIAAATRRHSGLLARLAECAGGGPAANTGSGLKT